MIDVNPQPPFLVGVDVGGTKVATLLVDASYTVLAQRVVATDLRSPEHTLEGIAAAVEATVAEAGIPMSQLRAVGIGVPGQVDPLTGFVRMAVNLNWQALEVGQWLNARLGVPCLLENDVCAAALGLYAFARPAAATSLVYLSIGTGVAAGVIIDGELHRGSHGMAGEIGHVVVDPAGPRCKCGAYGCLETLISGPAIALAARTALDNGAYSRLERDTSTAAVYAAAAAGDPLAATIVERAARTLALALRQIALTYDPDQIVIGGGVIAAGAAWLAPLHNALEAIRQESSLAQLVLPPERIALAPHGFNSGSWGGVALARNSLPARLFNPLPRTESGSVPLPSSGL